MMDSGNEFSIDSVTETLIALPVGAQADNDCVRLRLPFYVLDGSHNSLLGFIFRCPTGGCDAQDPHHFYCSS